MIVIPEWLDETSKIKYENEKSMLEAIELYAQDDGWKVSDGSDLSPFMRQRTDVLLEDTKEESSLRLAVLVKSSNNRGMIRVDASYLLTVVLVYQGKKPIWRVEAAGIRVLDNFMMDSAGWKWLVNLLFQQ